MLKKLMLPLLLFTVLLVIPAKISAEELLYDVCSRTPQAVVCQESKSPQTTGDNSIYGTNGILIKIAHLVALAVGIVAVIVIILGGIQYAISAGDPSKINTAKDTILYAIVGLVVALLAQAIITFVIRRL